MPRRARLDASGTLHHVIVRGIEKGKIVSDAADRKNFINRLAAVAVDTKTSIYAWVLIPNHAHLFLRSAERYPCFLTGRTNESTQTTTFSPFLPFNGRPLSRIHLFKVCTLR